MGDRILVRGIDPQGRPYMSKADYRPTMYIKSKKQSPWTTLHGSTVDEVQPGSIRETREFVKQYEDVNGFEIYGNTNYNIQYISDNYRGTVDWDIDRIHTALVDIETETEYGFPDINTANEAITLITQYNSKTKRFTTFSCLPFNNTHEDVDFKFFTDERSMLREFVASWASNYPDAVSGWNTKFFDVVYLVRRISRELGESYANMLSPWGKVNERKTTIKGSEELHYDILGIADLDYLELYKKFTYTKQESYALDYIAEYELGKTKVDHSEYASFKDFYTNDPQKFVEYNIIDVRLVVELEDKMRLIELCYTMAYNAKINFDDVFSPVRMWDSIIYNTLQNKNVVIPIKSFSAKSEQFMGAYVKDPIVGVHKFLASFDLDSLYPHLIMQYNISPETLTEYKISCTIDDLVDGKADTSLAKQLNLSMAANGWCYRKDVKGFLPELMEDMYASRSKFKKQMLAFQQEYELDKSKKHLLKEISRLNNLQMAMKIALNSAYGAIGNPYFRYFDLRMAESITASGQLSIRWIANAYNKLMNEIVQSKGVDYVVASDTDSIYLRMGDLVEKYCINKTDEQKIKFMDKVCEDKFQPFMNKTYSDLAVYMNAYAQKMRMKREVLADTAIWIAKKRYILNVHNSEGVQYAKPKIKVSGLEMVKSSTPKVIRDKLKESISVILTGNEQELHKFVSKFRTEFNKLPIESIASPRGVSGMVKYVGSPIYAKGTPIHVRGSLLHNHHLKRLGLDKKYKPIRDGDKIKFIYVRKPNPFHEDVISFTQKLPSEFGLERYIDFDLQFKKVFLDALQNTITPLGWDTEERSSLEDFFG
jgi:DNA polymerase elongation subunit (family B)